MPFNQPSIQERGNAMSRLLFLVAIVVILLTSRRNIGKVIAGLALANISMAMILYENPSPPVSLLHLPNTQRNENPYNNPMPYGDPLSPFSVPVPMHGERPGNITELSDGYFFNPVPDHTGLGRHPYSQIADENYWLSGSGDHMNHIFGPIR